MSTNIYFLIGNSMKNNVYVYLMNKKIDNAEVLYLEKKSKYEKVARALVESLDDYVSSSGKMNKDERFITASLILDSVFDLVGFASFPVPGSMKKDGFGKPSFGKSEIKISVAHEENYAVAAYSIGREIGVDIEGEIDEKKAEKLALRFPKIASLNIENKGDKKAVGEKIIFLEMKEDGSAEPLNLLPADGSFSAKWTAAEALMKCDGRGFSSLSELDILAEKMAFSSFSFPWEKEKIYVSIAMEELI